MAPKKRKTSSHHPSPPPVLEDSPKLVTREAEMRYHKSFYNCPFVLERVLPTKNPYFTFNINKKGFVEAMCASTLGCSTSGSGIPC